MVPERHHLVDVGDDQDVRSLLLEPLGIDEQLHGGDGKAPQSRADAHVVPEPVRDIAHARRGRLRGREALHGLAEGLSRRHA